MMKKMVIYKDEKYIVRYLWSAELFMFSNFSIAFIISKNVAIWFNSSNNGNSSHSVMPMCRHWMYKAFYMQLTILHYSRAAISSLTVDKVTRCSDFVFTSCQLPDMNYEFC